MNAHTNLVNAAISLINARGGYAVKMQSGVLPVGRRFVHAGAPGWPDVVGVVRWCDVCGTSTPNEIPGHTIIGRMIAVECKTGTGRLSATQRRVQAELEKRGAIVLTIRSIAELEEALR